MSAIKDAEYLRSVNIHPTQIYDILQNYKRKSTTDYQLGSRFVRLRHAVIRVGNDSYEELEIRRVKDGKTFTFCDYFLPVILSDHFFGAEDYPFRIDPKEVVEFFEMDPTVDYSLNTTRFLKWTTSHQKQGTPYMIGYDQIEAKTLSIAKALSLIAVRHYVYWGDDLEYKVMGEPHLIKDFQNYGVHLFLVPSTSAFLTSQLYPILASPDLPPSSEERWILFQEHLFKKDPNLFHRYPQTRRELLESQLRLIRYYEMTGQYPEGMCFIVCDLDRRRRWESGVLDVRRCISFPYFSDCILNIDFNSAIFELKPAQRDTFSPEVFK